MGKDGITRIEMDYMNAVVGMNRKMKDQREINWEERRYQIAKDVMAGMYSKTTEGIYSNPDEIACISVRAADSLIKYLKGGKENGTKG